MHNFYCGFVCVFYVGWAHCDLRWPNILWLREGDWMVIDFDCACPNRAYVVLPDARFRAPELGDGTRGPYSTHCDMYQVGLLMGEYEEEGQLRLGPAGASLKAALLCGDPKQRLSAVQAIQHHFFTGPASSAGKRRCGQAPTHDADRKKAKRG